jgi:hypothetical protein
MSCGKTIIYFCADLSALLNRRLSQAERKTIGCDGPQERICSSFAYFLIVYEAFAESWPQAAEISLPLLRRMIAV